MTKKITLTSMLVLFVFCMFSRDFKSDAISYLKQHQKEFALSEQDVSDLKVASQYTDDIGITHLWLQQTAYGVDLYNGVIGIHLNSEGKIAYASGDVTNNLKTKVNTSSATVSMKHAVEIAAKLMTGKDWSGFKQNGTSPDGRIAFDAIEGLTRDQILVREQYFTLENSKILLGWEVTIETPTHENSWSYHIDAQTGELIQKLDNVIHCNFDQKSTYVSATKTARVVNNAQGSSNGNIVSSPNAVTEVSSYTVFPYYTESPVYGNRIAVVSPDDATASPYGWHDTNGAAGAESTLTTGNNVDAYIDKDQSNTADTRYPRPDGTASLTYNFPLDLTLRTDTDYNAATVNNYKAVETQLFYTNNIMHDVMYQYGFTEAARNFQKNNYSRGGTGNDFVKAEAMDGSGRNNANFAAGTEGTSGRMQMYMFDAPLIRPYLIINAPAAIKDTIGGDDDSTGYALFGPCNFNVTGTCKLANDGSANPTYACNTMPANYLAGKIAIVDRNTCTFYSKVFNCQDAGAIGVIVVNRVDSLFGGMSYAEGTDDPTAITIPSLLVPKSIGDRLKANIATLNVTLYRNDPDNCNKPAANGALDNGVMIHEYGHGVSNRMTATGSGCLANAEQGGEGWSDFYALALTHKPADTKNTPRGIGVYVEGAFGISGDAGIRTYPYTYDMSVNPWTYGDLSTLDEDPNFPGVTTRKEVHEVGEIWTATLWDMYWLLIDKYGYNSNVYAGTAGTSGNAKAITLVTKGLSLQKCSPGFLDARDAILKADSILYAKANTCLIWQAFARRGMGYSAKEGTATSAIDQTEAFDLPPSCNTTLTPKFGVDKVTGCIGETFTFKDSTTGGPTSWLWRFGDGTTSTSQNPTKIYTAAGTYSVKLIVTNASTSDSLTKTNLIVIKPTPTTNAGADVAICTGTSTTLTATGTATSFVWTGGPSTATYTVTPTATTTSYIVTGTLNGCSSQDTVVVTLKPLPTTNAGADVAVCAGASTTLTATGTAASFAWTGGPSTASYTVTPTTTTTYTVTGTLNGCTSTDAVVVTVKPLPTTNAGADVSICSGASTTLTATGTATSYQWTGGPATASYTVSPTTTTTYTVTGTLNGCTSTDAVTVTVKPLPTVSVSDASTCAGTAVTLTASGTSTSYQWTGGPATASYTVTPTATTTYTVTGTLNGCTASNSVTVNVTALPNVTVNSPGICTGGTATLTAAGATTYLWSTGQTVNPITVSPSSTTTYTVTGTTGSCSKTVTSTVTVTNSAPTVTVTPNNTSVCNGDAITLTASGAGNYSWSQSGAVANVLTFTPTANPTTVTVTGTVVGCSATGTATATIAIKPKPTVVVTSPNICSGQTAQPLASGADSYTWTGALSPVAQPTTPVLTGTTTYTVTGTTNGCTGTAVSTVTVTAAPVTTLTASPGNSICAGDAVTLTAGGATTYTWLPSGSGSSQTITPSGTVTYTVTGTTNSCSSSASQTITVTAVPATSTITQGHDTLYSSTIVAGASYQWYLSGSLVATTSVPKYVITVAGNYTVSITKSGCTSALSAIFPAVLTGVINKTNSIKVFEVYPNPTEGKLTLNLNLTKTASVNIAIYTPEGREVYAKAYGTTRALTEDLNINDFAKGIYIIKLRVDEETYYQKVVKN